MQTIIASDGCSFSNLNAAFTNHIPGRESDYVIFNLQVGYGRLDCITRVEIRTSHLLNADGKCSMKFGWCIVDELSPTTSQCIDELMS